jgi:hypothetical protein
MHDVLRVFVPAAILTARRPGGIGVEPGMDGAPVDGVT